MSTEDPELVDADALPVPTALPVDALDSTPLPPFHPDTRCPKCWQSGPHKMRWVPEEEDRNPYQPVSIEMECFLRTCNRCTYAWVEGIPEGPPAPLHSIGNWNIVPNDPNDSNNPDDQSGTTIGHNGIPRRVVLSHVDDPECQTVLITSDAAQRLAGVSGRLYEALLPFSHLDLPPEGSNNDTYRLNTSDLDAAVEAAEAFEAMMKTEPQQEDA